LKYCGDLFSSQFFGGGGLSSHEILMKGHQNRVGGWPSAGINPALNTYFNYLHIKMLN
jgi:hypothetical protein